MEGASRWQPVFGAALRQRGLPSTVEDKGVRRVVALAEGNIDDVQSVQRKLSTIKSPAIVAQALREIRPVLQGKQSLLTDDTKVTKDLNVATSKLVETLKPLAFVSEPEKYVGKADIEVTSPLTPKLPDPSKGWVDMVYRILPGRTDNAFGPKRKAEIDIWANGTLVAEVRGNLGNPLTTKEQVNSGLYFMFGTYRARVPGTFRFQFDESVEADYGTAAMSAQVNGRSCRSLERHMTP